MNRRFTHGDIESLTPKVGAFIAVAERVLSEAARGIRENEDRVRFQLTPILSDDIAPSPHRFSDPHL